mgnify:FL=1
MSNMKTFVLRSKVATSSQSSPLNFGSENEVVLPMAVYEKLNTKDISPERRTNAIGLLNYIDSLTKGLMQNVYDLHSFDKGLVQQNDSNLFVLEHLKPISSEIKKMHNLTNYDMRIFQLCLDLKEKRKNVILISKNSVIREQAFLLGITAEPFKDELAPSLKEQYTGKGGTIYTDLTTYTDFTMELNKCIPIDALLEPPKIEPLENMFFKLTTREDPKYVIVRYTKGTFVPLIYLKKYCPEGYKPLNDDQKMMMECLLAPPEIAPFVVIKGDAGSGKTYAAVAAALQNIDNYSSQNNLNIGHYRNFLVSAPVVEMTQDQKMGYLPGDVEEKFSPYTGGFYDNILNYFATQHPDYSNKQLRNSLAKLFDKSIISFEPANFLRGRSISKAFFMLDEAQNFDPSIILDITTRSGMNSKTVLMGDPMQINAPDLNVRHNGVVYASEAMKGSPLAWQVTLSESVRSPLAREALRRMKK